MSGRRNKYKDLQSLLFHHALILMQNRSLPWQIHAEPKRYGSYPDLVLGKDEVFVEIKFSKPSNGGYTQALEGYKGDVDKLKKYKNNRPFSSCLFLAIDESNYFFQPNSQNYFNPAQNGLSGQ